MNEWRFIPGTDNLYKINIYGEIIKMPHIIKYTDGRDKHIKVEKKLKTYIDSLGYLNCGALRKIGSGRIHYLLAITFIGKIENGYVVDHKDNNKLNNSLDNLQIITRATNTRKDRNLSGCYYRKDRSKWSAIIVDKGKRKYLGVYECKEEATKAYQNALEKIKKSYE